VVRSDARPSTRRSIFSGVNDDGSTGAEIGRRRPSSFRRRLLGLTTLVVAVAAVVVVVAGSAARRSHEDVEAPRGTLKASPTRTAAPAARAMSNRIVRRVYGTGARAVAVVRPAEPQVPLPALIFLHGWGYQQAGAYGAWIRHLARDGNAVIVPRYQTGPRSDPASVRGAMLSGVRTALRRIAVAPGTLVVAGHSAGAALAADYAAVAPSEKLPQPRGVFAIYPGRAIIGTPGIPSADLSRIPATTRLLVMAGARDMIVGQAPAREMLAAARSIPESRRRFLLVNRPQAADHLAPLRDSRVVRATFWRRLDLLIDAARSPRGG
jgi:acetyl esterase/lipase